MGFNSAFKVLMYLSRQCRTYFMSPIWCQRFWVCS